jgi:hypothetical protein
MHWEGFSKNVPKSLELFLGCFKMEWGLDYRCDLLSCAVLVPN